MHAHCGAHFPECQALADLQAKNCRLSGSQFIENMHLDQKFCLAFTTALTWRAAQQHGKGHIKVMECHRISKQVADCPDSRD